MNKGTAAVLASALAMSQPDWEEIGALKQKTADEFYRKEYGSRKSRSSANPESKKLLDKKKQSRKATKKARKRNRK